MPPAPSACAVAEALTSTLSTPNIFMKWVGTDAVADTATVPSSAPATMEGVPLSVPRSKLPLMYFRTRSEEHTSELQSLMRISYAVFCLKKKQLYHKNIEHVYDVWKSK